MVDLREILLALRGRFRRSSPFYLCRRHRRDRFVFSSSPRLPRFAGETQVPSWRTGTASLTRTALRARIAPDTASTSIGRAEPGRGRQFARGWRGRGSAGSGSFGNTEFDPLSRDDGSDHAFSAAPIASASPMEAYDGNEEDRSRILGCLLRALTVYAGAALACTSPSLIEFRSSGSRSFPPGRQYHCRGLSRPAGGGAGRTRPGPLRTGSAPLFEDLRERVSEAEAAVESFRASSRLGS